jgi:CelD/BcsL family acetyltransferase involved in cellulose biosynthesis
MRCCRFILTIAQVRLSKSCCVLTTSQCQELRRRLSSEAGDGRFSRQIKLFSTGGMEVARGSPVDSALNAGYLLMIEVQAIDDIEELASYRLFWNSWLPDTPRASFFHTLEWLETYWDHFGDDQQLRALVVRSAGKPIGIVPLCIRRQRHRFGAVRVLGYPLDDWGTSFGPIGSNRAVAMLAAMQHLRHADRDWDLMELRWTSSPWSDDARAARSMRVVGMFTEQQTHQTTSVVDFKGDWASYLAAKSRKTRHEIRRVLRRTFEKENVTYIRHRPAPARDGDGDPAWDLYAMCQQVALASWQGSSTTGNTITHDRVRHFLRDAHAVAARLGMLDMNLLLVDGRPAAFTYNYCFRGRVSFLRMGYDPSLECRGLGRALLLRSIEDSFERGDESYDLGPGDSRLARELRTGTETSYRLTHAPFASWPSQAVRLAGWARRLRPEPGNPASRNGVRKSASA